MHAVITVRGAEAALAAELATLGIRSEPGGLDWRRATLSEEDLRKLQLRSQCASRVLALAEGPLARDTLAEAARALRPAGTFAVRAKAEDSQELQEEIGAIIHENGAPVNLKSPETLIFIHESDGDYLLGTDLLGDLSKRHYKIMTGAQSLTGPLAACTLLLSGWQPTQDILLWPCATGELAIEAALTATGKSPRAYELRVTESHEPTCRIIAADPKLPMVRATEKNAKVAGIFSAIRFSKQDLEWLDTKHDEHAVEHVVGLLPNLRLYPKFTAELFYQLDFILAPGARAAFLCINDDSASAVEKSAASGYTVDRSYLWMGKHALTLVQLRKKQKTKH